MLKKSKNNLVRTEIKGNNAINCLDAPVVKRKIRIIVAISAIAVVMTIMAAVVFAASVSGLSVNGLSASYNNGTWSGNGNVLNGSATGTAKSTCSDATSETSKLTLKNTKSVSAQLAFDYSKPVLGLGGSVKIDGTTITAAGTFKKELSANGSITVEIVSGSAGAYTSSINLTNITLVEIKSVTMTFQTGEGGFLSVNGSQVSTTTAITQMSTEAFSLVATPDSTHQFMGWYKVNGTTGSYIGQNANWTTYFEDSITLKPVFSESPERGLI